MLKNFQNVDEIILSLCFEFYIVFDFIDDFV